MLTLTFGYKKPQSNDKGPVVFPAMEDNIQRLNDHTHNGTNSAPLAPGAIVAVTQTILAANWVADTVTGFYKQTVTIAGGLSVDSTSKEFRLSTGDVVALGWKRLTATTYEIYTNDNTETITAYYK